MTSRRQVLALSTGAACAAMMGLAGCAAPLPPANAMDRFPPIVFVHGNGENAALWITTLWRFEAAGWPRERLFASDIPFPLARDDDGRPQPGRSGSADQLAWLQAEVQRALGLTGARRVVLVANSRGGYVVRNYIQNGGGERTVSHAVLGGVPNHGVWAIPGFREANEFSGTGPFLAALNAPKNSAGDEVVGPVKWLTVRSDNNDKFAQPDGVWIGSPGTATNIPFSGPELKGATNVVLARVDHRETSFSPAAFDAAYGFLSGLAPSSNGLVPEPKPVLNGRVTGLGLNGSDPKSGEFSNNLPLVGAQVSVFAVNSTTAARLGDAVHRKAVGADGIWGPFIASASTAYEFVVEAPGYATTHIYRSPFARGTDILNLVPGRLAAADREAGSVVVFTRPRGYFDAQRDTMNLDGNSLIPGVPAKGAGVSSARIRLPVTPGAAPGAEPRAVSARFNDEAVTGRAWPAAANHLVVLELTY